MSPQTRYRKEFLPWELVLPVSIAENRPSLVILIQRAENGGLDPPWLNLAFLGRPDFQSRDPKTLILKGLGASGGKIGAPQKRQIQPRRIQPPILGPLIDRNDIAHLGAWNSRFRRERYKVSRESRDVDALRFRAFPVLCMPCLLTWKLRLEQESCEESVSLSESPLCSRRWTFFKRLFFEAEL